MKIGQYSKTELTIIEIYNIGLDVQNIMILSPYIT